MLRPLRLLAIGKEQLYTPEDQAFLEYAKVRNIPLVFQAPCPKNASSAAGRRYGTYPAVVHVVVVIVIFNLLLCSYYQAPSFLLQEWHLVASLGCLDGPLSRFSGTR